MKSLLNIFATPTAYRVVVLRDGVKFQAYVPHAGDPAAALKRAIELRNRFIASQGVTAVSGHRIRSNTGVPGVCELTKWAHGRAYQCFQVTCGQHGRRARRFYYRNLVEREPALQAAIAHRQQREAVYA